jgi:hypothetical protein
MWLRCGGLTASAPPVLPPFLDMPKRSRPRGNDGAVPDSSVDHLAQHEPLRPTLELFPRLGLCDLDLNLNHIIERGVAIEGVRGGLGDNGQRVWIVVGGWCDFFDPPPKSAETVASVARQVAMARALGVDRLRLFFGWLSGAAYYQRRRCRWLSL